MHYICNCKKINLFNKSYTYWEDRVVTTDELDIINFLFNQKKIIYKSILHIGIGNSYFASKFSKTSKITGISISQKEIEKAQLLNLPNYNFFLLDKYSIEFKNFLKKNKFDLVIDTNLKSYTCCQESFEFMIHNIFQSINLNGMLITSINGMNWFKKLKPKLSFSFSKLFFFKLKEINGNKDNILLLKELELLSQKDNLNMSFDEKLCYLKK
ncbi:class I SAM-dependent methyltransferase [Candidatus Pelagibacter sp.]|nr:class I SAM-dependent methyltransferase [Candidatus Pelagibacter sp.]